MDHHFGIFAAERNYRQIARCALGDGSDATPILADGRIYLRGREHLWCLGDTPRPSP